REESQRVNENDLVDLEDLHGRGWDDEGDEIDCGGCEGGDDDGGNGGGDGGSGGEDDSDTQAELLRLEGALAAEKSKNADLRAELADLESKLSDLKALDDEAEAKAKANVQAAQDDYDEAVAEMTRWDNIVRALRELNDARDAFAATSVSSSDMPAAEQRLENARAALRALGIPERTSIASAEASFDEALTDVDKADLYLSSQKDKASNARGDNAWIIQVTEEGIKGLQSDVARSDARIESLESRIRNLKRQNQLAGPAPQPSIFDLINARGIHTWVSGDITSAEDTRSGQRRDTDAWRVTVGGQVRVTERITTGMSLTYGFSDTDDTTGFGTSKEADTYLVSPFVAYRLSPDTGLRAGVVYSQTETDAVRASGATASYTTRGYGARAGISTREQLNPWVTVRGGLSQSFFYSETDGYTDSAGLVTPNADSTSSTTHVSTRADVAATPDLSIYGALNGSYALLKSDGDRDRADAYLGLGADYDAGFALLSAEVGKTVFRNNYSDINARVTAQVTF
ncbi:MAG: autotransporter domain-containing protein, partial [Candidatus Phaeomarinobacter sp.]